MELAFSQSLFSKTRCVVGDKPMSLESEVKIRDSTAEINHF